MFPDFENFKVTFSATPFLNFIWPRLRVPFTVVFDWVELFWPNDSPRSAKSSVSASEMFMLAAIFSRDSSSDAIDIVAGLFLNVKGIFSCEKILFFTEIFELTPVIKFFVLRNDPFDNSPSMLNL